MTKKTSREAKKITSIQTLMIRMMTTLINLDDAADYDEDSNDDDVGYESDDYPRCIVFSAQLEDNADST